MLLQLPRVYTPRPALRHAEDVPATIVLTALMRSISKIGPAKIMGLVDVVSNPGPDAEEGAAITYDREARRWPAPAGPGPRAL